MIRNLPPLCKTLIFAIAGFFLLDLFAPKVTGIGLPLYSPMVYPGMQLWRIVTYPFLVQSLISALGTCALIFFFGVELETIVHTRRLSIWLVAVIILGGILAVILPTPILLAGPQVIYLFLLTGFTYLWPKREVSLFGMFSIKSWIIALVVFFLSIIPMNSARMDFSISNLFLPFYSVLVTLILFHVTYRQYAFGKSLLDSLAGMVGKKQTKQSSPSWDNSQSVDRQIDMLLEKISRSGMDSLSAKEREFLYKNTKK